MDVTECINETTSDRIDRDDVLDLDGDDFDLDEADDDDDDDGAFDFFTGGVNGEDGPAAPMETRLDLRQTWV